MRRVAALALICCLSACASNGGDPATSSARADSVRNTLAPTDHGLRIRQWRIADNPGRIALALTRHADGEAADPAALQRLKRNGFRFVRVPAGEVDALLEDLGGAALDVDGWHGQAHQWQEIVGRPVAAGGRAIAVDGRVRRVNDGRLRLKLRGWTVPMEDGPAMHVELLPEHDRTRATRLDQLLGQRSFEGEHYATSGIDALLEAGWAYVLTCEIPEFDWGEVDEAHVAAGMPAAVQPQPGTGPPAPAPLTLGEVLLRHDTVPLRSRDLLVLIPRVPDAFFPEPAVEAESSS